MLVNPKPLRAFGCIVTRRFSAARNDEKNVTVIMSRRGLEARLRRDDPRALARVHGARSAHPTVPQRPVISAAFDFGQAMRQNPLHTEK